MKAKIIICVICLSAVAPAPICLVADAGAEELRPPDILDSGIYVPEREKTGYEIYRPAHEVFPKDPHAAMVFSLLLPGSGHLYTEHYYWAAAIIPVFGVSTYLAIDGLQLEVKDPNSPDQREPRDQHTGSIAAGVSLLLYFYSAQDAYSKAKKFNQRRGFKFLMEARNDQIRPQLSWTF